MTFTASLSTTLIHNVTTYLPSQIQKITTSPHLVQRPWPAFVSKLIVPQLSLGQLKVAWDALRKCVCLDVSTWPDCGTYMLHHSVLQILPPLLPLLWIRKDVCGRAVGWALSQLLPIILHQRGPAHQLHSGELFQKVPKNGRWEILKIPLCSSLAVQRMHMMSVYVKSCYDHSLLSGKHTTASAILYSPGTKVLCQKNSCVVHISTSTDTDYLVCLYIWLLIQVASSDTLLVVLNVKNSTAMYFFPWPFHETMTWLLMIIYRPCGEQFNVGLFLQNYTVSQHRGKHTSTQDGRFVLVTG